LPCFTKFLQHILLLLGGEWLQLYYVSALHQDYGLISYQHHILMIAKLASGSVVGTMAASSADK